MPFPKIMTHKHKDLITKLLLEGRGVRYVSKTLKEMYPNDKKMHISVPTLQAFRKEHLRIEGDVLDGIKKATRAKDKKKNTKKEHTKVKNLPSYKQKLEEVVDMHVDIRKSLTQIDALIRERLQQFFDMAQRGEAARDDEKLLQGYFDRYFVLLDKWAKYVDKLADQRIEQNISITVVNEQMQLLRTAVTGVLQRMDPSLTITFIEELNQEMGKLSYSHDVPSLEEIHHDVGHLKEYR